MNKKEILEIKRNFTKDTDNFTLNKVIVAISDGSGEIKCERIISRFNLTDYEESVYKDILKKVLNTKLGSKLTEYEFPNSAYEEGHAQNMLYTLVRDGVNNITAENYLNRFCDRPIDESSYAIITAHCTYTVFRKDKSDSENEYDTEDFKFILTAFCPIISGQGSLTVEIDAGVVHSECPTTTCISDKPIAGFMFPTFNHRSSDINSIMVYDAKADVNSNLIEGFLECESRNSASIEKDYFNQLLVRLTNDQVSFQMLVDVYTAINELVSNHASESEPLLLNCKNLKTAMESVLAPYVSPDVYSKFEEIYRCIFNESTIMLTNIAEDKLTIKLPELTIALDVENAYAVSSSINSILNNSSEAYQINDFIIHK